MTFGQSPSLSVHIYIHVFRGGLHLSLSLYIYKNVCLFIYMYIYIYVCVCVSVQPCLYVENIHSTFGCLEEFKLSSRARLKQGLLRMHRFSPSLVASEGGRKLGQYEAARS